MLLTQIHEVADETLILDPNARETETDENTWWLTTSVDERGALSVRDVVVAFEQCASILRQRIRALGYTGPATFYVWHDEQAGQLRCSTGSVPMDRLPFGARVELVPLEGIVEEFLEDMRPGQIPWEEFEEVSDSDPDETRRANVLRVWARSLA